MQPSLSLALDVRASSPSIARTQAREFVASWASRSFSDDLALLVTELVTNAVVHGAAPISVEFCLQETGSVRVEVSDGSSILPTMRVLDGDSPSGRGLCLVDALAADWGAHSMAHGKVVWFELTHS